MPHTAIISDVLLIQSPGVYNPLKHLRITTWARRAWTFQECYFSRRRLFFTERQVIFACNTGTAYEADTMHNFGGPGNRSELSDWFSDDAVYHDESHVHERRDDMSRATEIITSYSHRTLTFDVDALNAIAGALNTFAERSIYHTWGVPCRLFEARYGDLLLETNPEISSSQRCGEVALLWYHWEPCKRRSGFPSWSAIAWAVMAVSFKHLNHPIDLRIHADAGDIGVHTEHRSQPFINLMQSGQLTAPVGKQLSIRLKTTLLKLSKLNESDNDYCVAMNLRDEVEAVFEPRWDVDSTLLSNFSSDQALLGALFLGADSNQSPIIQVFGVVMLLQQRGTGYERVGILRLPSTPLASTFDSGFMSYIRYRNTNSSCYEPGHVPDFLVEQRAGPGQEDEAPNLPESDPEAPNGYWWWKYFGSPETIILE